MKGYISICLNHLEKENILDDQVRTEYLKYKVKKIFKSASKETQIGKGLATKETKKLGK